MKRDSPPRSKGFLDRVEKLGNKLPDPTTLFLIGTVVVMLVSELAVRGGWTVTKQLPRPQVETVVDAEGNTEVRPELGPDGEPLPPVWEVVTVEREVVDETGRTVVERVPETYGAVSLLSSDGLYWALQSMVSNFINFAPLGVVLVGMLGIGIAERVGLIAALLKAFMSVVPPVLLTPTMVFLGVMSSMGIDAGYVVLPPLAAALYKAAGRSPLAGLAAVFAGVAAGFNANLFVTGLDPMLASFATIGAQVIDPDRAVNPACNWWFMIASTFVITLTGWWVTARFVERRLVDKAPEDGGPVRPTSEELAAQRISAKESSALKVAAACFLVLAALFAWALVSEGAPLYGEGAVFQRWAHAIVPVLFFAFLIPALGYGIAAGEVKDDKTVAKLLTESIAAMAPIIVLAFFAAQFIEYFKHSGLDRMLALWGGQALGHAQMPAWMLILAFIVVTMVFNLFIGSMSAKYAMFAPIFIPMFMMVGISPELTQAAYRIGDSVTNSITPLNPYLVIILVFMQRFVPRGGLGTLISTMLPYSIAFGIVWTAMLLAWMAVGAPLGVDGGLWYDVLQGR